MLLRERCSRREFLISSNNGNLLPPPPSANLLADAFFFLLLVGDGMPALRTGGGDDGLYDTVRWTH